MPIQRNSRINLFTPWALPLKILNYSAGHRKKLKYLFKIFRDNLTDHDPHLIKCCDIRPVQHGNFYAPWLYGSRKSERHWWEHSSFLLEWIYPWRSYGRISTKKKFPKDAQIFRLLRRHKYSIRRNSTFGDWNRKSDKIKKLKLQRFKGSSQVSSKCL